MLKNHVCVWTTYILYFALITSGKRTVSPPEINPGCDSTTVNCSIPWVVHTTAEGKNDILHHIWGTVGAPTFMSVVTSKTAELEIDWAKLKESEAGAISFTDEFDVSYSYGIVIPNMIFFNDAHDSGKIDDVPEEDRVYIPMANFIWTVKDIYKSSSSEGGVVLETTEFGGEALTGKTKIRITSMAYGEDGQRSELPHLLRTPNSTQLDIILDHLILDLNETAEGFSKPRWAMEWMMFSMEHKSDVEEGFKYDTYKSLDDEYTPGVFNLEEITTPLCRDSQQGGYMQWKAISYTKSDERIVDHSTFQHMNTTFTALEELDDSTKKSLAYAAFGERLIDDLVSTKTIVSFGETKDKFYTESNYTTWTVAYGVGSPPTEKISILIIIVTSLGIGIPTLVFVGGGMFLGYRKITVQH